GHDFHDSADLVREVIRHHVYVVGQVFPGARDTGHDSLAAQLAFRTHFTRKARNLGRKSVQLVHHRVDGFLQLQNFAFDVHRDLAGKVAARDGGRDFGDVTYLTRQVASHRVDVVRQVLPRACDTRNDGLTTQLALGTYLAG